MSSFEMHKSAKTFLLPKKHYKNVEYVETFMTLKIFFLAKN